MLSDIIDQQRVLETLDGKTMWLTLLNMTRPEFTCKSSKFYDPDIVLRVLSNVVKLGAELKCKEFVKVNGLSFAFAATSFAAEERRIFGYTILNRFLRKLKELTDESFAEAPLYMFFITMFKHSVDETNQRISNVVSHFFARVSKLVLSPTDPVYAPIMAFFSLKPFINLRSVPEFGKLFYSSSTQHFSEDRAWILRLCSQAMIDARDYGVLNSIFVLESCQLLFLSTIADFRAKNEALRLFFECSRLESVALDMFNRMNFTTWIVQATEHSCTNDLEIIRLVDIFLLIVFHLQNFHSTPSDQMEERSRRRKRARIEATSNFKHVFCEIIKANAERLLETIRKNKNPGKLKRIEVLEEIVSAVFNLSKPEGNADLKTFEIIKKITSSQFYVENFYSVIN